MVRYVVYPRGVLSIPVSFKALTGASFETRIRECAAPHLSAGDLLGIEEKVALVLFGG